MKSANVIWMQSNIISNRKKHQKTVIIDTLTRIYDYEQALCEACQLDALLSWLSSGSTACMFTCNNIARDWVSIGR